MAANHGFSVTSGSALAVSDDGAQVYVANEDHLAVFVVDASMRQPAATRVVPLPGPPAQIVASQGLVLVTVRTLPTDDARAAYEALRGPAPEPAAVHRLPFLQVAPHPDRRARDAPPHGAPREQRRPGSSGHPYAGPHGNTPPPHGNNPSPAGLPTGKKASRDKPAPRRNTPAVPLDPNVLRKSQGGLLMAFRPDAERGLVEVGRRGSSRSRASPVTGTGSVSTTEAR